jgi:intein-encoded DNA endonuclease-like protein
MKRSYAPQDRENVRKLFDNGKTKSEISRETGIPFRTIVDWVNPKLKGREYKNCYTPIIDFDSYLDTEEKQKAYSFILAVYLCDGNISTFKTFRAPLIRFYNDTQYPKNTQEWAQNLQILLPENFINIHKKKTSNCFVVCTYSKKLLDLFPQHGIGKKHNRKLELTDWQKKIIEKHPQEFIRGCIQSDGCIYFQSVGKYSYKKYSFTNRSEDIIDFFLLALKFCGIEKKKYFHPKGQFVVQNFNKNDLEILESIISVKE